MGLIAERWSPSILGFLAALLYLTFMRSYRAPDTAKDLLGAAVSIGAIAVGFLANMKAILFSIEKKKIIQQLKDARYYNNIVDYLYWAIVASSFLAIISAAGLMIDVKGHARLYPLAVSIWVFAAMTTAVSYWRVISLFTRILRSES